jgi:hypothetical protein
MMQMQSAEEEEQRLLQQAIEASRSENPHLNPDPDNMTYE